MPSLKAKASICIENTFLIITIKFVYLWQIKAAATWKFIATKAQIWAYNFTIKKIKIYVFVAN